MRCISILVLILTLGTTAHASSPLDDDEEPVAAAPARPRNLLYFDPLLTAMDAAQDQVFKLVVGYERVLDDYFAVGIEGMAGVGGGLTSSGVQLALPVYLLGRAPTGLYVAPMVRGLYIGATGNGLPTATGYGLGGSIGWAWLAGPVSIRAAIGAEYVALQADGQRASDWSNGVRLLIGYAF